MKCHLRLARPMTNLNRAAEMCCKGYHIAAGLVLPSNSYTCLAALVTALVVRWVYDWQVKLLDISTRTWANL